MATRGRSLFPDRHNQKVYEMPKLQPIKEDENASISIAVDEKAMRATVSHTVKENRASPARYQLKWVFDFSETPMVDVLKLATRTICIKVQADWRKAKDRMDAEKWQDATFKVEQVLAEGRKSADPVTKAKSAVSKLSKAEREALIAELLAANES